MRVSSDEDLSLYLKEKTNYDFLLDNIKTSFSEYYNEELKLYYYLVCDSIFEEHKIVNS